MELFALVAAYWIMRTTGKVDGLTGPGGLFPGIELGPRTSTGAPRARGERYRSTERLAPRPGPRGVVDHGRNRWASWTDRARRWGEGWADRIDADRAGLGGGPDSRPWSRRLRDQRATCPRCGHGGLAPHAASCDCTSCLCQLVEAPRRPTPTPAGGDGAATPITPTIPPDVEKATRPEKETPVSVTPTAPTSNGHPVGYPAPPSSRTPVAPAGSAPVGRANTLPVLDPSDVRFTDARQGLSVIAKWLTTLADGLGGRDVDTHTLGMIANMRDVATTTDGHIVRVYGAVQEAVNSSSHVAQLSTYKAR